MIRRVLTGFILFVVCLTARGAKAYPYPINVTQKDGTTLTILLNGDERHHYVTTTDGVLLSLNDKGYYIATIEDNGNLKPSRVLAHNAGMRTEEEIRQIGLQDRDKFYFPIVTKPRRENINDTYTTTTLFPHIGTPKALVILADFVDKSFKHDDETTIEIFNQYLNATVRPSIDVDASLHKNYGSVKMYFSEMSNNLYVPHFDIEALVHLPDSMKVYGSGTNEDMNKLFKDACSLAKAEGVDFSIYDENND